MIDLFHHFFVGEIPQKRCSTLSSLTVFVSNVQHRRRDPNMNKMLERKKLYLFARQPDSC